MKIRNAEMADEAFQVNASQIFRGGRIRFTLSPAII